MLDCVTIATPIRCPADPAFLKDDATCPEAAEKPWPAIHVMKAGVRWVTR